MATTHPTISISANRKRVIAGDSPAWRCVLRDSPQELPWHDRQASDLFVPTLVRVQERNAFVMELC